MIWNRIQAEQEELESKQGDGHGEDIPNVHAELGVEAGAPQPHPVPSALREQFKRKKKNLLSKMTALEEDTIGQPDTLLYRAEKLAKELVGLIHPEK